MKVVRAQEMSRIEKLAYAAGSSEEAFMEAAGSGVAERAQQCIGKYHLKPEIVLLCGRGNNGGDAYVAGRILLEGSFHVKALAFAPFEESSPLNKQESVRFQKSGGLISYISKAEEIDFGIRVLLIDGLLGTGFHGSVEGIYREVIERANRSGLPILSIDIPSGVDGNTGAIGGIAICATETLALGLPKTGSFLGDAWNYTGNLSTYDFGLPAEFIAQADTDFELIEESTIERLFPPVKRTRHKYEAGYVVGLGGSPGMPGAPLLSSFAALRAGAGIVRLLHPKGMEGELSGAPYEVIREEYGSWEHQKISAAMQRAGALFVGPGVGTSQEADKILRSIMPDIKKPCVIDAEALTLYAKKPFPLPPETILTPHHGEMKRLLGLEEIPPIKELLGQTREFAEKHNVTIVLKGAPTFIIHPHTHPWVCTRGNPGMATAGSGDVLTGIIAAFLAQGKKPVEAALLGVYFHGVAGEYAASEKTPYSMVASDITEALPHVFHHYYREW